MCPSREAEGQEKQGSEQAYAIGTLCDWSPILALVLDLLMAGTVVIVQPDIVE